MRALGIDFGLKRVGLAISDRSGILVSPYLTLERTTRDALFEAIIEIIRQESVEAIVVGLPLSMDGEDTLTTRQARNFAQSLGRRTDLPIHLADERLTSAQAEEELNAADLRGTKRKMALDSQAAVIILRTWLENALSS
ncbi:MAG: Holliday junction resolvase RuvX [Pseudodesulfovibrio sp.]|uniref:Putative pre-16S rRNA nuclease n=1 Tax=Pseudodesulfovibrio aespoeensis (strain ATCC 700646 / DSM 10631 / Aspo-2) TaxID=643562 RepID=E6VUD8_PSEA9|nr:MULTISPECIES: Holliday junction resolvase RuvX [Pseudodesulfovibrio]MBU4190960.1 Holliday junction resolvase RuvX [Pseudomonadota bacterium]MCG2733821.1 Holliday junction resolvase RuvX [Pseudodesulfovibrio aespoeensis]ADU63445.1 Holliday junction resolvase YqgF [Pseudodesulfovibrio aespoeensis Aspo-2]MBU4243492.1 Holliday junction resolvase RuvX [Pseudomonadota bacterium]MBU4377639.1 Holliday junction resolvase RuvX [Pseudomonadota bacterium]